MYPEHLTMYPGGTLASVTKASGSMASHQEGAYVEDKDVVDSNKLPRGYNGIVFLLPETKEIKAEFLTVDSNDVHTTHHINLTGTPPPVADVRSNSEFFGDVSLKPRFEHSVSNRPGEGSEKPLWQRMKERMEK
tara:strand:- start:104 stop:505 length:402 start_codon:yes stop_codon:yes gene_type:complete